MKRMSSIPPITSTGNRVRNPSAPLSGLANISLGRYMSNMKKNNESEDDSYDFSKFSKAEYNKKSPKKDIVNKYQNEEIISITTSLNENYNENGDFAITLNVSGFEFSDTTIVNKIDNSNFTIRDKEKVLYLTTTGDIFECTIVNGIKNRSLSELFIPKLLKVYNSLSMNVIIEDNCAIVIYHKK